MEMEKSFDDGGDTEHSSKLELCATGEGLRGPPGPARASTSAMVLATALVNALFDEIDG